MQETGYECNLVKREPCPFFGIEKLASGYQLIEDKITLVT